MRLEEISVLCDEVSSLVKAGLPLEAHLVEAGQGHGQRLQDLTATIAERLENGEPLAKVVQTTKVTVSGKTVTTSSSATQTAPESTFVAACIAAGVRTGRLSDSIEIMGDATISMLKLRRRLVHSMTYPFLVLLVACLLFSIFVSRYLASVAFLMTDMRLEDAFLYRLVSLNDLFPWWPMLLPAIGFLVIIIWFLSGRAAALKFTGLERILLWLPGVPALINHLHQITFGRILTLLVERTVPLHEALVLAGHCCGDRNLALAGQTAADNLTAGRSISHGKTHRLPTMFEACLNSVDITEQRLVVRLSSITAFYERRLQLGLSWLQTLVPALVLIVVGGGAVVVYSLSVFLPMTELFFRLSFACLS